MMNRLKFFLLYLGLPLMVIGFFYENAMNFPLALKVFAPNYYKGIQVFDRLVSQKEVIRTGDSDFNILLNLYSGTTVGKSGDAEIIEFQQRGSTSIMHQKGTESGVAIVITYRNGKWVIWPGSRVRSRLEEIRKQELFSWGKILFAIGAICYILVIIFEVTTRKTIAI